MEVDAAGASAAERVPPELWLVILQYAVHIDNEMLQFGTFDPFDSPVTSPPFAWSARDSIAIRENIGLRHNLVLVCRLWHALISPTIYEIVFLNSDASVRSIHRTLVMTAGRSDLGRQTRHFLLGNATHESAILLAAVFRCMPLIQTVSLWPLCISNETGRDIVWPEEVSDALGQTCGASLLKLNLGYDSSIFFTGSKDVLHRLLTHTPNLRSLGILDDFLAHSLRLPRLDNLSFLLAQPGLTTSFQETETEPPFPSLTHFYIQASRWPRDTGFLSKQGSLITSLTLNVEDFTHFSRPDIILQRIAALWTILPHITRVHLITHRDQKLGRIFLALPPTTTHLGIWSLPPFTETNHTSGLALLEEQEVFLRGAPELPAPSVVRFTNPEHARWMREVMEDQKLDRMAPLRRRGLFKLEDWEGGVLLELEGDREV
ncbi:hypothetical protein PENSPDRAFT_91257 [Peniophora sp. CONT]|nr:hypothetical protein PENSPDRAFT_91257 [Peniophora sp. CONT]